jgi:transcriptional regulator with XRE-family HTH domain
MTKGARKLAEAGGTQEEKAKRIGVEQQTVSRWFHGAIPNGKQLIRIEQEYGIPVAEWLEETPPEAEPAAEEAS